MMPTFSTWIASRPVTIADPTLDDALAALRRLAEASHLPEPTRWAEVQPLLDADLHEGARRLLDAWAEQRARGLSEAA